MAPVFPLCPALNLAAVTPSWDPPSPALSQAGGPQGRAGSFELFYRDLKAESGTTPADNTPEAAARLLRMVNVLGNVNIVLVGTIGAITTILSIRLPSRPAGAP